LTAAVPLPPAVEARLRELGRADVLVGIPSSNDSRTTTTWSAAPPTLPCKRAHAG
jgi:hypothetical protein